jgi:hypothetical protein
MNANELISILESGLKNSELHQTILRVLALLRGSDNVKIDDHQREGASRSELLGIFRVRQKHLAKRGIIIQGLNESVLSLSNCDSERIYLVSATVDDKWVSIWLTTSNAVVGCHFGNSGDEKE